MLWLMPLLLVSTPNAQKIDTDRADTVLIRAAREARASKDQVRATAALRAWSTRTRRDQLPEGLEGPAADAIAFAKAQGMLRLYASRVPGRIRVGVADPAGAIDRIDAHLTTATGTARLVRLEGGATGRFEYQLAQDATGTVHIDAVSTRFGEEIRLVRTTVANEAAALPNAPNPEKLEANVLENAPPRPPPKVSYDEPALPWWVIVGGVVAAALAGAGIYQETR